LEDDVFFMHEAARSLTFLKEDLLMHNDNSYVEHKYLKASIYIFNTFLCNINR
jgi:hypothetical protein